MKNQITAPSDFKNLGFLLITSFKGTDNYTPGAGIENFDLGYEKFAAYYYTHKNIIAEDLGLTFEKTKNSNCPIEEQRWYHYILKLKGFDPDKALNEDQVNELVFDARQKFEAAGDSEKLKMILHVQKELTKAAKHADIGFDIAPEYIEAGKEFLREVRHLIPLPKEPFTVFASALGNFPERTYLLKQNGPEFHTSYHVFDESGKKLGDISNITVRDNIINNFYQIILK